MGQLEGDAGTLAVDEVDDPLPGVAVLRPVHPRAAGGDAGIGRDIGHLGEDQAGAAQGPGPEMDQMEVADSAVGGRIHAHRRDHDAVGQGQAAQLQGREHGCRNRVGRRGAGRVCKTALDRLEEVRVAQAQVLVADPLAAGQQAVGELQRIEVGVAVDGLEPFGGVARGALQLQHLDPALGLIGGEAGVGITLIRQGPREADRVLEGQFGTGADREMRRVGGVPQQHHPAVAPALAGDAGEVEPGRAALMFGIAHQRVAVQPVGEEGLGRAAGPGLVHPLEAEASPGGLGAFDDEGRCPRFELVGVRPDPAVRRLDEGECEGVEGPGRAQPDVFVGAHVDIDAEDLGCVVADPAVQAVCGDDDVCLQGVEVGDLAFEMQNDAQ